MPIETFNISFESTQNKQQCGDQHRGKENIYVEFNLISKIGFRGGGRLTQSPIVPRFKSIEIEELQGLEFHHKMQKTESIEELSLELQPLASKAFPCTPDRDFNKEDSSRKYIAVALMAEEKFQELYNRV